MFFQGNSLGLLTEIDSFASSFYLYFSYSVSLEEKISSVVLEDYLLWEHPCVVFVGLIFGGQRLFLVWMPATSSLRVCSPLFP